MLKLAIIRTSPSELNINQYNVQEIGFAKGLFNLGVSTDIFSFFSNITTIQTIIENDRGIVRLIPIKGIKILNKISLFPKLVNDDFIKQYDIIQVHEDSQLMTALILLRLKKGNIKRVLYQGMYTNYRGINRVYQIMFDFLFNKIIRKNADYVFAKTNLAKQYLLSKGYKNINLLPIGLDYGINNKVSSLNSIINNYRAKYDKVLLYVGKIEQRRNPKFLIDVFSLLRHNNNLNYGLIIVGDGPLVNFLANYAQKKNVLEHILKLKNVPNNEINDIYKICNLLLLPSSNEIYGMVVLEAIYNGLPVISSLTAGPMDIIINSTFGCCLPLNEFQWSESIIKNLSGWESENLKELRRKYIIDNFNWNKIARKYLDLIIINENSLNK